MTGNACMGGNGTSSRLIWLDAAKGIAILCTVIGHTFDKGSFVWRLVFSFHMPLFFMLAGYTIKPVSGKELISSTIKDFKRLIVPVFILRGINLLYNVIFLHKHFTKELVTNIQRILWGNRLGEVLSIKVPVSPYVFEFKTRDVGIIWFLIALFWSRLCYRLVLNKIKTKYRIVVLLICTFLSILFSNKIGRLPQNIDMIPVAMLFMEAGYLFKKMADKPFRLRAGAGVVSLLIWMGLVFGKDMYIDMALRDYPSPVLCILTALSGCLFIIFISMLFEKTYLAKPLVYLGKNSLELLCIHHLDMSLLWEPKNALILERFPGNINIVLITLIRIVVNVLLMIIYVKLKKLLKDIYKHKKIPA